MRLSRSSSTAERQPKLTPPKLVPPCRASSVATARQGHQPIATPRHGTFQKSGGPPPRANPSSHSPAADRRSTRPPHARTWCRAVTNSEISPRDWVHGNTLSYAEFARSPLSEERRQADPPAGLSLFNHHPLGEDSCSRCDYQAELANRTGRQPQPPLGGFPPDSILTTKSTLKGAGVRQEGELAGAALWFWMMPRAP